MNYYYIALWTVFLSSVDATSKQNYNNLYTVTTFSDINHRFPRSNGQVAEYSNTSITNFRGKLYEPPNDDLFDCSKISNLTAARSTVPSVPFIVLLPMSGSSECAYKQANIADRLGAIGIVFYSSNSKSTYLEVYHTSLKILVSYVSLTDHELSSLKGILDFTNAYITVTIKESSTLTTNSHTFYFVVFAFTVLVVLSLTWFFITYARRCYDHYATRRRRNRAQRTAMQTIKKLPTKKYKMVKTSDSESMSSLEDPVCAVCLDSFKHNDCLRELPCNHEFHQECIDPWLKSKGTCPLCKFNIIKDHNRAATATVSRVLDVDIEEQQLGTASDHEMVDMVLEEIEDEDETNTDDHQVLPVASNTTEGIEPSI